MIEEAVRISVTRDPAVLANTLFPVIGEAVRKSVAHALRGLVESINQTLERSLSLEALMWRIEAMAYRPDLWRDRTDAQPPVPCRAGLPHSP